MIIKASERSGGQNLANHLTNEHDNEHIECLEISGFVSDDVHGAFREAFLLSKSTRCSNYLFSVSLSPPKGEFVSDDRFKDAAKRLEEELALEGQPKVLIIHEKEGRRHLHAVYSKIDADNNKAIHLSYYKNRLNELSKNLYLENEWALPQGFITRENRNPLNYTIEEWQQAKRLGENPKVIKSTLKECWAISDSRKAFESALEQHGFYLAKGDRRGFVAVDWRGEVYSLSRWLNKKQKILVERLGDFGKLDSIESTKQRIDRTLIHSLRVHSKRLQETQERKLSPLTKRKHAMITRQRSERRSLSHIQQERSQSELKTRQERFRKGVFGLWDRLSGRWARTCKQNELEYELSFQRDKRERETLVIKHLQDRLQLDREISTMNQQFEKETKAIRQAIFTQLPEEKVIALQQEFNNSVHSRTLDFNL